MNLNLQVKYSTTQHPWLCFKHAVKAAIEGEDVTTDIDDFSSEHYLGPTYCELCSEEDDHEARIIRDEEEHAKWLQRVIAERAERKRKWEEERPLRIREAKNNHLASKLEKNFEAFLDEATGQVEPDNRPRKSMVIAHTIHTIRGPEAF